MDEQASEIIENLKKYEINPTIECREFLRNYARNIILSTGGSDYSRDRSTFFQLRYVANHIAD